LRRGDPGARPHQNPTPLPLETPLPPIRGRARAPGALSRREGEGPCCCFHPAAPIPANSATSRNHNRWRPHCRTWTGENRTFRPRPPPDPTGVPNRPPEQRPAPRRRLLRRPRPGRNRPRPLRERRRPRTRHNPRGPIPLPQRGRRPPPNHPARRHARAGRAADGGGAAIRVALRVETTPDFIHAALIADGEFRTI
jgi:hypothetical protein